MQFQDYFGQNYDLSDNFVFTPLPNDKILDLSLVLGWGSEVSCPRTLPRKNPEDLVRLEPRNPGLRVEHLATEPCGTLLNFKPWSHRANRRVADKKSFNPFISVLCSFLIQWIRSLSGDVRWCLFRLFWSFDHVQNFLPNKTDRDARLMYGCYVASVRRHEFCHLITKLCMFCPFSLRNKSICRSDQAFRLIQPDSIMKTTNKTLIQR